MKLGNLSSSSQDDNLQKSMPEVYQELASKRIIQSFTFQIVVIVVTYSSSWAVSYILDIGNQNLKAFEPRHANLSHRQIAQALALAFFSTVPRLNLKNLPKLLEIQILMIAWILLAIYMCSFWFLPLDYNGTHSLY